jgi:hypothetical protein
MSSPALKFVLEQSGEKHLHIYDHLIVERTEGTTISGIEQHAPE